VAAEKQSLKIELCAFVRVAVINGIYKIRGVAITAAPFFSKPISATIYVASKRSLIFYFFIGL